MFTLRGFIQNGLLKAVGQMADYQVILNAAGWFEKGVLTQEDLAEIQQAIDEKNAPPVPEEAEQPQEQEEDPGSITEEDSDEPAAVEESDEPSPQEEEEEEAGELPPEEETP